MNALLPLAILSTICCSAYSAAVNTKEEKQLLIEKCRKEFNVEEKIIAQLLKLDTLPDAHNAKCLIACYMKGVGMFNNGKFDLKAINERDKADRKDPVIVKKAVAINKKCSEKVSGEKEECKLAHNFLSCLIIEGKAAGIPTANIL